MLKKVIIYEDFNGVERQETCYFHLSKSELVEMELSREGGLQAWLQKVMEAQDGRAIMDEFKKIILKAYGERSEDGSRFTKSESKAAEFLASPAYDALFFELVTNAGSAAEFINGVIPQNMKAEVEKLSASQKEGPTQNVFEENSVRELTPAEVREMDATQLQQGLATGRYRIP